MVSLSRLWWEENLTGATGRYVHVCCQALCVKNRAESFLHFSVLWIVIQNPEWLGLQNVEKKLFHSEMSFEVPTIKATGQVQKHTTTQTIHNALWPFQRLWFTSSAQVTETWATMKVMKCCSEPHVKQCGAERWFGMGAGWARTVICGVAGKYRWVCRCCLPGQGGKEGRGWEGEGQCEVGHKSTWERMEPEVY